jgi:hypothetical protein
VPGTGIEGAFELFSVSLMLAKSLCTVGIQLMSVKRRRNKLAKMEICLHL